MVAKTAKKSNTILFGFAITKSKKEKPNYWGRLAQENGSEFRITHTQNERQSSRHGKGRGRGYMTGGNVRKRKYRVASK